jgi:hypothetical protein
MHGTAFVRLRVNKDVTDEERNMIGGMQAIKTLVVVAAVISWLIVPVYSQGFSKKEVGPGSGYPVETYPKVDEKGRA